MQEEEQEILLTLGIESHLECVCFCPVDRCAVVGMNGHICIIAEAGEKWVLDAEILGESNAHIVGFGIHCHETVVLQRGNERERVIAFCVGDG